MLVVEPIRNRDQAGVEDVAAGLVAPISRIAICSGALASTPAISAAWTALASTAMP
jgi:hypothetical protein